MKKKLVRKLLKIKSEELNCGKNVVKSDKMIGRSENESRSFLFVCSEADKVIHNENLLFNN